MAIGDKYIDFTNYLIKCGKNEIKLNIEEIEKITYLPKWVYNLKNNPWTNTKQSFGASWRNADYKVTNYDKNLIIVTFVKIYQV